MAVRGVSVSATALALGAECRALGARPRTVEFLTGLSRPDVQRYVFKGEEQKSGKFPGSPEWLYKVNVYGQVEASFLIAVFARLARLGVSEPRALITAYRQYRIRFGAVGQIDFDRGFNLAAHFGGIWSEKHEGLALYSCSVCSNAYLSSIGNAGGGPRYCPFCKVVTRFATDVRTRQFFSGGLPGIGAPMVWDPNVAERASALQVGHACRALGARVRTVCYVSGLTRREVTALFFADDHRPRSGRHHDSNRWLESANLFERVEASMVLSGVARLLGREVAPTEALLTAFQEYAGRFGDRASLDLDRAFDLVSHYLGIWAERKPSLRLGTCSTCHSQYAVVPADNERDCPFCELLRRFPKEERIRSHFSVGAAIPKDATKGALFG